MYLRQVATLRVSGRNTSALLSTGLANRATNGRNDDQRLQLQGNGEVEALVGWLLLTVCFLNNLKEIVLAYSNTIAHCLQSAGQQV